MSNRYIKWVIGLGVLAILALLAGQAYFFYKTFDLRERQTVQSLRISLQAVAEGISQFNKSTLPDNIIHQFSPDYYIVDINNHIDPWVLEHYLRSELTRRHLDIDFEYAIYDCNDDRMVYGNYVSLAQQESAKNKLEYWPKYDEGLYYFGVHFPGIRKHILSDMGLWYFFTAILAVVIAFFGYSMMVILKQKRLSEVQRDFINNMSHEFRTPLTSIGLAADVVSEEGISGNQNRFRQYANILRDQINVLQKKVDRILQHSETEQRFFRISREKLVPKEIVAIIIDEFKATVEHRNGSISLEVQSGDARISADPHLLSGMLVNLIDNAIKYSVRVPEIRIRILKEGAKILLQVCDNGAGIEKKHLRRIFMPFYRVPSGNVHNVKGSGLGLSYVRRVCELHGWKIRISSDPGSGTTFTVIMPSLDEYDQQE